jgi:hypothetical protein
MLDFNNFPFRIDQGTIAYRMKEDLPYNVIIMVIRWMIHGTKYDMMAAHPRNIYHKEIYQL